MGRIWLTDVLAIALYWKITPTGPHIWRGTQEQGTQTVEYCEPIRLPKPTGLHFRDMN